MAQTYCWSLYEAAKAVETNGIEGKCDKEREKVKLSSKSARIQPHVSTLFRPCFGPGRVDFEYAGESL